MNGYDTGVSTKSAAPFTMQGLQVQADSVERALTGCEQAWAQLAYGAADSPSPFEEEVPQPVSSDRFERLSRRLFEIQGRLENLSKHIDERGV